MEKRSLPSSGSGYSVIRDGNRQLMDPQTASKFPALNTRVFINWWSVAIIAIFSFMAGSFWYGKKSESNLAELEKNQKMILERLASNQSNLSSTQDSFKDKSNQLALMKLASDEFRKVLEIQQLENQKIIKEQRDQIDFLKKQVSEMAQIRPQIGDRTPASVNASEEFETIPYNLKNSSIQRFEQDLEKKDLERKLQLERDVFLSQHDLKYPENREKFEQIEKNHKLTLYELEQEHNQQRRDFSQNKYRFKRK